MTIYKETGVNWVSFDIRIQSLLCNIQKTNNYWKPTYDTITELIRYMKLYLLTSITVKWKFVVIVDLRIRKSKHRINA